MVRRWAALFVSAGAVFSGCGTDGDDTVLVLAASSLTDVFEEMETAYEQAYPGVDVELSFAGSNALRLQIDQGAPADVVATANEEVMNGLAGEGHVANPMVFATNRLVVASPTDGSGSVTSAESLSDPDLLVGLSAVQVPCGRYASDALAMAGVEPSVDTYESDVRSLATKLAMGELDVGVVYATDAASVPGIRVVAPLDGAVVRYPIAALVDSPRAEEAAAFVDFVLSAEGRAILVAAGFETS